MREGDRSQVEHLLQTRLQKYLNNRFLRDVEQLKEGQATVSVNEKAEGESENISKQHRKLEDRLSVLEKNYNNLREEHAKLRIGYDSIEQEKISLAKKIDILERNNLKLGNNVNSLSDSIYDLRCFENIQKEVNKHTDDQMEAHTDVIKLLKLRVDKQDEEISLLVHNDALQDEKLEVFESSLHAIQTHLKEISKMFNPDGLSKVLDDILALNKENKALIERIQAGESKLKEVEITKMEFQGNQNC